MVQQLQYMILIMYFKENKIKSLLKYDYTKMFIIALFTIFKF